VYATKPDEGDGAVLAPGVRVEEQPRRGIERVLDVKSTLWFWSPSFLKKK
jgi:hypothetical protein